MSLAFPNLLLKRLLFMLLVPAVLILVMVQITALAEEPNSPDTLPLSLQVRLGDGEPVTAGQEVEALVILDYIGVDGPINAQLSLLLPAVQSARAAIVPEATGGIQTAKIIQNDTSIIWRGRMQPEGRLTIRLRIKTALCTGEESNSLSLISEARVQGSEEQLVDTQSLDVQCLRPLTGDDISVTKQLKLASQPEIASDFLEAMPNEPVWVQIALSNHLDEAIIALITDRLSDQEGELGEGICTWRVLNFLPEIGDEVLVARRALSDYADGGVLVPKIEAGQTRTLLLEGVARTNAIDCSLTGQAAVYAVVANAVSEEMPLRRLVRMLQTLAPIHSNTATIQVIVPDLGDASDSSNHFGVAMTAYPGIQAQFPTVFDPATANPPGPRHQVAPPLRLGQQVSRERDADLNPNRNLNPPGNQNNLDTRDDGINPGALGFAHCTTSTMPVRVGISKVAFDHFKQTGGSAYLNVWLDGDRNGDWSGAANCGPGQGSALEHIVIDHLVDVQGLGSGLHNILVNSGPVLWLAEVDAQPAWLRLTLSEQPAPKVLNAGGVSYGDGRGPTSGYLLGETEDYLLSWDDTTPDFQDGADMSLDTDIAEEADAEGTTFVQTDQARAGILKYQAIFRNVGDQAALDARLLLKTEPYLGMPSSSYDEHDWTWCLTCTLASEVQAVDMAPASAAAVLPIHEECIAPGDCYIVVDMMEVPPGRGGRKIFNWNVDLEETGRVSFDSRIESNSDFYLGDNVSFRQTLPNRRPATIISPGNATVRPRLSSESCDDNLNRPSAPQMTHQCIEVQGLAEPGTTVRIFADGFESGNIAVDQNGRWSTQIDLVDGSHRLQVRYVTESAAINPSSGLHVQNQFGDGLHEPLTVTQCYTCIDGVANIRVNSLLPWNPSRLQLRRLQLPTPGTDTDNAAGTEGDVIRPQDVTARTDVEGWVLPLEPDGEYEISVETHCDDTAEVALIFGDNLLSVNLSDADGDGTFLGTFTNANGILHEENVSLNVSCGAAEIGYAAMAENEQSAAIVLDGNTGDPLIDAEVTLWQGDVVTPDLQKWRIWPGEAFGQTNPQKTNADGNFGFYVPEPGRYRLTVTREGYQSFRSQSLRLQGSFPSREIVLMPELDSVNHIVTLTEDGFDSSQLWINPGDIVRWRNLDLAGHSSTATDATQTALSSTSGSVDFVQSINSGVLTGGEVFNHRFDSPGEYTFYDNQNTLQRMKIVVNATEGWVYMPLVVR